jgi:hypothetical protein
MDWRIHSPSLPVDAPLTTNRSATPVVPRDEERDPPTPVTRVLWVYKLVRPLRDIMDLERIGTCPKNYEDIDKLHQKLIDLDRSTPPSFRMENPDWRWDNHPNCYWLVPARFFAAQILLFDLICLHRPYIFTRATSRTEALKASISMLQNQMLTFQGTDTTSWKKYVPSSIVSPLSRRVRLDDH